MWLCVFRYDVMAAEVVRNHNEHEYRYMIDSFLEKLYTYFTERPRTEVTLEVKYYVLEFGLVKLHNTYRQEYIIKESVQHTL